MSAHSGPVLVCIRGVVQGEVFPLTKGRSTVIGRSRSCDISLSSFESPVSGFEKASGVPEPEPETRNPKPETSKTVSRRHLKVTFQNADSIELEDLSSNGTFVDGRRIDRLVITDAREKNHEIQLGGGDAFRLEWR